MKAGCKSACPALADDKGFLNIEILGLNRPVFKDAVQKGLTWFVMHWGCPKVWPNLPRLVIGALNANAQGMQGEVEMMLFLHQQYVIAAEMGEVDWVALEEQATRTLPTCAPWMGAIAK